ncbi:hypothetical protein E2R51_15540 [Jeotgalibacillus sp. S-D1]|uniref:UPF0489 family protein n=1 Tax=Jeotgalibacillus sp. S-D1 TaxID=2552189 RepID=UPI00105A3A55|nr:UPF0489 family protein [Jeotgalibacillus sp. S-D1]TDL31196.1 hypothetical protein E2R51_15540 [Jeotgalibacillus sp. S-D1]
MIIPEDFRVYFSDKNIFIVRDHNWAFPVWELQKRAGKLKPNAILVHVDAHLDDIWDGLEVEGLHEMKNSEDVFEVTKKLKIENFIWPAVGTGTIDRVIYVSQFSNIEDPFNFEDWNLSHPEMKPVKEILNKGKYTGLRYWSIEEFLEKKNSSEVKDVIEESDLILDLDLDYFAEENIEPVAVKLMDEQQIIDNLEALRDLFPWRLITVSLSPFYCGGEENAGYLLNLFYNVFDINYEDGLGW